MVKNIDTQLVFENQISVAFGITFVPEPYLININDLIIKCYRDAIRLHRTMETNHVNRQ